MSSNELATLRALVKDESLPITERRDAAAHLMTVTVNGVPSPAEDDPEIVDLMTPWSDQALAQVWANATAGRSMTGWSLADAKAEIHARQKLRPLLAVVVDEAAHELERLAACAKVLEMYPNVSKWKLNNFGAERLFSEALPSDGIKWTAHGPVPVSRPPMFLQDVWRF